MSWHSRWHSRLRARFQVRSGRPVDARRRSNRPTTPPVDSLDNLMEALRVDEPAPDVSAAVLARLGYVSASAAHVRRGRVLAWTRRIATTAGVVALLAAGVSMLHTSRMERARGGAIEDVVRTSLDQNRQWLGDVAQPLSILIE